MSILVKKVNAWNVCFYLSADLYDMAPPVRGSVEESRSRLSPKM